LKLYINLRAINPISDMEIISCNLCGADKPERIATLHDAAFDTPGNFDLVRCSDCGLIYYRNRPDSEEINRYYPPEYLPYRSAIQDEHSPLIRWARTRNVNKRRHVVEKTLFHSQKRILDVGCSTGIFLDAMQQAGWDTEGIEINSNAAQYAQQRFGLKVITGQLKDNNFADGAFDTITFWDVLEHTFDPLTTLNEAHRLLRPGGTIAMTLPHWESLDRRLFGEQWIGFDPPRHLYVFTTPVLGNLLQRTGFTPITMRSGLGGYYTFLASLRIWLKVHLGMKKRQGLLRVLEIPGMRMIFQPYFSLIDALNLGGTLVVVARKDDNHQKGNH
jgi:SAM-dependent methyltransferase